MTEEQRYSEVGLFGLGEIWFEDGHSNSAIYATGPDGKPYIVASNGYAMAAHPVEEGQLGYALKCNGKKFETTRMAKVQGVLDQMLRGDEAPLLQLSLSQLHELLHALEVWPWVTYHDKWSLHVRGGRLVLIEDGPRRIGIQAPIEEER